KWLIERQLKGEPALSSDPAKGAVKAPWLSWGPYLWANGETKRADGFHFLKSDFQDDDQMHHSEAGMRKLGNQLLLFFKGHPPAGDRVGRGNKGPLPGVGAASRAQHVGSPPRLAGPTPAPASHFRNSQTSTVLSLLAEASRRPSGLKASPSTRPRWPSNCQAAFSVPTSQTWTAPTPPAATSLPSGLNATPFQKPSPSPRSLSSTTFPP